MHRFHEFAVATGNFSLVINPPGQVRMQLPQPMHRLSSTLMIVSSNL